MYVDYCLIVGFVVIEDSVCFEVCLGMVMKIVDVEVYDFGCLVILLCEYIWVLEFVFEMFFW